MDWKGWLAVIGSIFGLGATVVAWVSGYGEKAINEGRSMQRLEAVEHTAGELKDTAAKLGTKVGDLEVDASGMKSDIKNIYSGQARIEAGQLRIEKILEGKKK